MLSKKLDQFCWCLLCWIERQRRGGREHQLTLKEGPLDGRRALVTCDWLVEQAGHRLLVRRCCPFVAPLPSHPSLHWGILPSLSDTEGLDQQLTRHTHRHARSMNAHSHVPNRCSEWKAHVCVPHVHVSSSDTHSYTFAAPWKMSVCKLQLQN